jgi:hypothetical protein
MKKKLQFLRSESVKNCYRSGWRISETQEPQCLCLTPLNLCSFGMATVALSHYTLVPDRDALDSGGGGHLHLIARDASGAGRLYTALQGLKGRPA